MAEKRMFAKSIVDSDMFLDMPPTAQLLYFHLCMRADDDGFVNNPKRIMRDVRCSDIDIKMLIAKNYIIPFESGIVVIRHWRLHNYIQKDRYKPTLCEEKNLLKADNNRVYEVLDTSCIQNVSELDTDCIQNVSEMDTQIRLDKIRLDKKSIEQSSRDNILSSNLDDTSKVIHHVVDYLNEKRLTNFHASTIKTQKLIKARLKEGFNLSDFMTVIDRKCRQWIGTEYERYLRPETLFGNKFEGYLNESDIIPNPKGRETPSQRAMRIGQGAIKILEEMEANNE